VGRLCGSRASGRLGALEVLGALALIGIVACGEPAMPARAPDATSGPDTAWIHSAKLDGDAQEFLLRAYDEELAFPFRVRLAAPLEAADVAALHARGVDVLGEGAEVVARCRPSELESVVASEKVTSAKCAAPPTSSPDDDTWREKVDVDVRTIYAAHSACFTPVLMHFGSEVDADARDELEKRGAVVRTFDARSSIAYVPIRAIPQVAALPFVQSVEPAIRAFGG
jgi:hypothetical protein